MMTKFDAVGIAEGFLEPESEAQIIEAWQYLIDSGLCWQLQGSFGRTAQAMIEQGICTPAEGEQAGIASEVVS